MAPRWRLALTLLAALFIAIELMTPPVPGIADNGDFGKLLGRYGLGSGQIFVHAGTKFRYGPQFAYDSGFQSSELLFVAPAVAINRALSRDGSFDLRVIGGVHIAVLALAVWLASTAVESVWIVALGILFFTDFLFAGYLNSFYMDTGALLFTLLGAAFYVRRARWRKPVDAAGLFLCAVLASTASPRYVLLAPFFAALLWTIGARRVFAAAATVALLATAWVSQRFFVPEQYSYRNFFSVIFAEILPHAPDQSRALAELGLDDSWARWNDHVAYEPAIPWDDPAFYRAWKERVSYGTIVRYYLRHPSACWGALTRSLDEVGRFQSPLGNFDAGSGRPPASHYGGFQIVSGLERRLFFQHGGRLFAVVLTLSVALAAALLRIRRKLPPGTAAAGLVLIAMTVATMVASSLADVSDQVRHHLLFLAQFHLLLLATATALAQWRGGSKGCN